MGAPDVSTLINLLWRMLFDYANSRNRDIVYAATALIARLRQSIRVTPCTETAELLAACAARALNNCIVTTSVVEATGELNIEKMTGLSYYELIRQCLTSAPHDLDPRKSLIHISLVMSMIRVDNSPVFQDVVVSQNIVSWSASVMKLAIPHYRKIVVISIPQDPGFGYNLYNHMISMFRTILDRACVSRDERPAVEAVNAKVLHLVEWWSEVISNGKLGQYALAHCS